MELLVQIDVVIVSHSIFSSAQDYVIEQLEGSSKKSWDCSMLLKEDMETIWLRKQEAVTKRERMKKYSSSHRVTAFYFAF